MILSRGVVFFAIRSFRSHRSDVKKSKYSAKGSGAVLMHCFVLPF
jgi:hypothetical protein